MGSVLVVIVLALAVARVTWLVSEDRVTRAPREWIVRRKPDGLLAYFVNCWFCVGTYVSAGAAAWWVWGLDRGTWQEGVVLWPALGMAGVMIMLLADVLMANGSDD